jgi:hypothetical protein
MEQRLRLGKEELLESRLGFAPYTDGQRRLGWLLTFSPVSLILLFLCLVAAFRYESWDECRFC